eukprot:2235980-Rhodomonas_salina.2
MGWVIVDPDHVPAFFTTGQRVAISEPVFTDDHDNVPGGRFFEAVCSRQHEAFMDERSSAKMNPLTGLH